MRVLCIGPGDWLVVSLDESTRSKICEQLGSDLERQGLAIVDLTDGLTRLAVQGSAAREALSTACGIDFHPRSFPVGRCARTRFAHTSNTFIRG
jgi:sarcosine oxidase subunit gamma